MALQNFAFAPNSSFYSLKYNFCLSFQNYYCIFVIEILNVFNF